LENNLSFFISNSLDWLTAHLNFFALPSQEEDEAAEEILIDRQRKAFGELALACMLMSRYSQMKASPQFEKALDHIESQVRKPEYSFNMVRRLNLFPFYLTVFAGLEECGRTFPEHRFAIQRVLDFGHVAAIERTSWGQIDLRFFLDCGGFKHSIPDYKLLYRVSSIYGPAPIPYLRDLDVYALTHILFYMADFGRRDLRPILAERFDRTRKEVALLLGAYTYEKDWDLVAELLICCLSLDYRPSPLFELAWQGLLISQEPDGKIPMKLFDPQSRELADPRTAAAYQFKNAYHSTLVGLFAAMMELNHGELR
jgi:hypothetical protein